MESAVACGFDFFQIRRFRRGEKKVYNRYQTLNQDCGGKEAGILFWRVDHNLDLRKGVHLVEIAIFESNDALQAFRRHPKHQEFTETLLSKVADWKVGDIYYPVFLGKVTKTSCQQCGNAMIKTRFYDPDGEVPLHNIVKIGDENWFCVRCNGK